MRMESNWEEYAYLPNHLWELVDLGSHTEFHIEQHQKYDVTTTLHTHNFIQIYYIHRGQMHHSIIDIQGENTMHATLMPGDLFILPPWLYHQVVVSDDILYTSICFYPEFIHYDFRCQFYFCDFINYLLRSDLADYSVAPKCSISFQSSQGEVVTLLHAMRNEYIHQKKGCLTYIKGDLLKLLVIIARQYTNTPPLSQHEKTLGIYYDAVYNSIHYIYNHFDENLTIDHIAKQHLISRTYFCTLFKQITGYTVYEFIQSLRLNHSKVLLQTGTLPITDIAQQSGFYDLSNFSRTFKKAFGMTPSQYRKHVRLQDNTSAQNIYRF